MHTLSDSQASYYLITVFANLLIASMPLPCSTHVLVITGIFVMMKPSARSSGGSGMPSSIITRGVGSITVFQAFWLVCLFPFVLFCLFVWGRRREGGGGSVCTCECVWVFLSAYASVCVCVRARASVCVCVCARVCVFTWHRRT